MIVSTIIISDLKLFANSVKDIDAFVNKYSKNPFTLSSFILNSFYAKIGKNQKPLILIAKVNSITVGFGAFLLKKNQGMLSAEFVNETWSSSDFVTAPGYEFNVIKNFLDLLFNKYNCKFLVFHIPKESKSIKYIREICKSRRISLNEYSNKFMNYGLIKIDTSWSDYQKARGRLFQKEIRYMERRLSQTGNWNISVIKNCEQLSEGEIFKQILSIENFSWKEKIRSVQNEEFDPTIIWFLDSFAKLKDNTEKIERQIWFLQLNGQPVAYAIILTYKGTAYITKTSYIDRWRHLSVGKYLITAAIKNMFESDGIKIIDFMTFPPFVSFWATSEKQRLRITLGHPTILKLGEIKTFARKNIQTVLAFIRPDLNTEYVSTAREQLEQNGKQALPLKE